MKRKLLKYVQEPSIMAVLSGYDNDPIKDRVVMEMGKDEKGKPVQKTIFTAKKNGEIIAVAFGEAATGYNGPIEVMVGIDTEGRLTGIGIMTHAETPGLGARVEEADFRDQFVGLELSEDLAEDGGYLPHRGIGLHGLHDGRH